MKEKIQILIDNGMSISAIARNAGVGPTHLNKYMKGTANFSEKKMEQLRLWLEEYKNLIITNF